MPNEDKTPKSQLLTRRLAIAMLMVSFIGFIDAAYLTVTRYTDANVPCTLTHACDEVLHSQYSTVLGIPVVVLGVVYYLCLMLGSYGYLEFGTRRIFQATAVMTIFGLSVSAWFVYVQFEILHAVCQYCLLSALISTILFGLGLVAVKISWPFRSPIANAQE